jgi:hypothetical protein
VNSAVNNYAAFFAANLLSNFASLGEIRNVGLFFLTAGIVVARTEPGRGTFDNLCRISG